MSLQSCRPAGGRTASTKAPERNPGFPLDLDWVGRVRMNRSALERRAGDHRHAPHGQEGLAGRLAAEAPSR